MEITVQDNLVLSVRVYQTFIKEQENIIALYFYAKIFNLLILLSSLYIEPQSLRTTRFLHLQL